MKYRRKAAAFAATVGLLPLWCPSVQAQAPGWTIEEFQAQGTITTTETGDGGQAFINEETNAKNLDLSTLTLTPQNGVYVLALQNYAEIEGAGMSSSNGEAKLHLQTSGGQFRVRIKGPTGCAGQTRQVSFLIQADASSWAEVEGPDEIRHYYGEGEDQYTTAPAPARSTAASMAVSAGAASGSADVEYEAPPSGNDSDTSPSSKHLFQRLVTFGLDETAIVEIPLSITSEAGYTLPNSGNQTHGVLGYAQSRIRVNSDTRSVKLTRPGAIGETTDLDGTVWGHSVFSYWTQDCESIGTTACPLHNSAIVNHQTFNPVFGGTWTWKNDPLGTGDIPDVTYTWAPPTPTGNPYNVDWDKATWDIDFGTLFWKAPTLFGFPTSPPRWAGTPTPSSPKTIAFTYNATDNGDGATATAKYMLIVHDPWEVLTHTTAPGKRNYRPHPYGSWVDASMDGDTLVGQLTQQYDWNAGVTFSGPDALIAKIIGVDVSFSRTASVGVSVGNEHNNVRKGYRARIMIWDAVIVHSGTADHWTANGYDGNSPFECEEPDEPAGGMHLGPLEWGGVGPEPPEGPIVE